MSTQNILDNEQTGGWLNIQIASLDEISFCPQILTNNNAHTIAISGDHETLNILPIPEKFLVNVTPRKNASGTSYSISISFDFPFQSAEIDSYLNRYKNKKVIALGTDTNRKVKIFGSKNHPLDFSYQEIQGKKLEDPSITRISVDGSIGQKPVYIGL